MSKDQAAQRRFIAIPFSSGCRSQSSVDVVDTTARHAGKKPQPHQAGSELVPAAGKGESLVARLLRGFKNLSQIFAVYDEEDEEEQQEMVIGLPTDVKHVAHIGWDGSTNTTTSLRSWNRAAPPPPDSAAAASTSSAAAASTSSAAAASTSSAAAPQPPPQQQSQQMLAAPPPRPLSVRQFELAMAAQAAAGATANNSAGHRRHS